jgi:FkbM family methyltransferase
MNLSSLAKRIARVTKFTREATSLSAIPVLVAAAIARDSPFGHIGVLSSTAGRCIGVVKVRTCATRGEIALINTHDLGHLISCEEVLIEQIYDFAKVPFAPDLIVDCGAQIGLFTLIAGLHYSSAELIVFEPNSSNFRMARQQLARFSNRLRLVEAAVSIENGEGWFYIDESNSGHLTDHPTLREQQRVRLVNLLDEVRGWPRGRLLLKMDIEGAERAVLPHIINSLPSQCAIFFEAHGGRDVWHELSKVALQAGFQVAITRERTTFIDGFAVRN